MIPIFLIIIFNTVVLTLIIRVTIQDTLKRKKDLNKTTRFSVSEVLKMSLSFIGIMILFGLAWIFAVFTFMSEPEVSYTIQFIFSFLNAFQGFFIFIFFILLNSDYRKLWKAMVLPANNTKLTYKNDFNTKSQSIPKEVNYVIENVSFEKDTSL